jgi:hypothetical protein
LVRGPPPAAHPDSLEGAIKAAAAAAEEQQQQLQELVSGWRGGGWVQLQQLRCLRLLMLGNLHPEVLQPDRCLRHIPGVTRLEVRVLCLCVGGGEGVGVRDVGGLGGLGEGTRMEVKRSVCLVGSPCCQLGTSGAGLGGRVHTGWGLGGVAA